MMPDERAPSCGSAADPPLAEVTIGTARFGVLTGACRVRPFGIHPSPANAKEVHEAEHWAYGLFQASIYTGRETHFEDSPVLGP